MKLHNLKPATGATRPAKRIGRGQGSGTGGTSTKGHKGAQARTGYNYRAWFEGGQMPLIRRVPKFGFKNPFRVEYEVINLDTLQKLADEGASAVDHAYLVSKGLISRPSKLVKVLGRGVLKSKITIQLNKFSATAKTAIEAAGGTATEI
jgi:large subunit ribosomal protein L15